MISSDHGDFAVPLKTSSSRDRVDLSEYDGQRICVIFDQKRPRIVLQGTARFIQDDAVGNALNIQLDNDEPGQPVLVISEEEWQGRIIPDFHYGCKYSLILD
jgi:hypothetical protein